MRIPAKVIPGYGAASGKNKDPRYKGGTIQQQIPYFKELGLDLSPFFPGTLNIDISPYNYEVKKPRHTFHQVDWSKHISPENFFFFDIELIFGEMRHEGLIYMPDPSTKEEHVQKTTTLELMLPKIESLNYGDHIEIEVNIEQLGIEK